MKNYLLNKAKRSNQLRKIVKITKQRLSKNKRKILGSGNELETKGAYLLNVDIEISGNNNEILIQKGASLSNVKIFMQGENHRLIIHEDCLMKKGVLWFEDNACEISIGAKTTIEDAHLAVTEPFSIISVGEDCMFSANIDVRTGDSHSIIDETSGKRLNYAKNVSIGNHVWIGNGVSVLKGVSIGDNSIIGIKSLVTKNIPSNKVATGIPAKVIKGNVNWDRQRIYN